MIGYNPSYLTDNKTLLEEFLKIRKYLEENPIYKIYQTSDNFTTGTTEYALSNVVVPTGDVVGIGDVILFSNVYYGVVMDVSETTFTIATGISFRGEQGVQGVQGVQGPVGPIGETGPAGPIGETGPAGPIGETGPAGANGVNGTNGTDGLSIYLYKDVLSEDTTTVNFVNNIEVPTGHTVEVGDLLLSTANSSFGEMVQVVGVDDSGLPIILTVEYVGLLSIGDYDKLENKPIINADLHSGYHTPVARTYYRHTGTTLSPYVRGVIYYYDGSTYTEIIGGGGSSGGGVTDVQVNGTSVVTDGVANIPPASNDVAGVVTTGEQTFYGVKSFWSNVKFHYPRNINNYYTLFYGGDGNRFFIGGNSQNLVMFNFTNSPSESSPLSKLRIDLVRNNYPYLVLGGGSAGADINISFPNYSGTLLAQPSRFSTGTSGSVTLSESGLYEIKTTLNGTVYPFIVNWDGTNGTCSMGALNVDGDTMYRIVIDTSGVVNLQSIVTATATKTTLTDTISYRKIGRA